MNLRAYLMLAGIFRISLITRVRH